MTFKERKFVFRETPRRESDSLRALSLGEGVSSEVEAEIREAESLLDVKHLLADMPFDVAKNLGKIFWQKMRNNQDFKVVVSPKGTQVYAESEGRSNPLVQTEKLSGPGNIERISFFKNGVPAVDYVLSGAKLLSVEIFENGKKAILMTANRKILFGSDGKTQKRLVEFNSQGAPETVINRETGQKFDLSKDVFDWDINQVRKVYPEINHPEFLGLLAVWLDTPEKLSKFLQTKIKYLPDKGQDTYQFACETLRALCGDCEDFAFLAKSILQLQGKNPRVLAVPNHATTVWTEKVVSSDGKVKYVAYDLSNIELVKFEAPSLEDAVRGVLKRHFTSGDMGEGSVKFEGDELVELAEMHRDPIDDNYGIGKFARKAKPGQLVMPQIYALKAGFVKELMIDPRKTGKRKSSKAQSIHDLFI